MGGSSSKEACKKEKDELSFVKQIRSSVEDEVARRMMIQREVQMAVNMARARDTIWIFGSAWATLVTGIGTAKALGRNVPPLLGAPVVIGALVLGNMADMAYGNKLNRVVNEAEYILANERARMVPFKQSPFQKFYSPEERAVYYETATAVGELFPNRFLARPGPTPDDEK